MIFDIRENLNPKRLTIAMWDYSWLNGHYPGGSYEDFNQVTDELLDRGFNTIRIEAFPWIIGQLKSTEEEVTISGEPLANWGVCDRDRKHAVAKELEEFLEITLRKGISVILSTWSRTCQEYPEKDPDQFITVWDKTLLFLNDRGLLEHVLYIDLDQEFPYFSPNAKRLKELDKNTESSEIVSDADAMNAAGQFKAKRGLIWNEKQLDFVHSLFNDSIAHFHRTFPAQRFTFSLTSFWEECEHLNLKCFDVLELHFWIHGERFDNRTGFTELTKDRGERDYEDYQSRLDATFHSVRPILLAEMHQRLKQGSFWAEKLAVPLVTTEAWGPWWHMDHRQLRWDWLRNWCSECNQLAAVYGLWGSTPWNFSHPYWENWKDVQWYRKVNNSFFTGITEEGERK